MATGVSTLISRRREETGDGGLVNEWAGIADVK
jgi:hypothetical protein